MLVLGIPQSGLGIVFSRGHADASAEETIVQRNQAQLAGHVPVWSL